MSQINARAPMMSAGSTGGPSDYYPDISKASTTNRLTTMVVADEVIPKDVSLDMVMYDPCDNLGCNGWFGLILDDFFPEVFEQDLSGTPPAHKITGVRGIVNTTSGSAWGPAMNLTGTGPNPVIVEPRNDAISRFNNPIRSTTIGSWSGIWLRISRDANNFFTWYYNTTDPDTADPATMTWTEFPLTTALNTTRRTWEYDSRMVIMLSTQMDGAGNTNSRTHIQISVDGEGYRGGDYDTMYKADVVETPRGGTSGTGASRAPAEYDGTESLSISATKQADLTNAFAKTESEGLSLHVAGQEVARVPKGVTSFDLDGLIFSGQVVEALSHGTDYDRISRPTPSPVTATVPSTGAVSWPAGVGLGSSNSTNTTTTLTLSQAPTNATGYDLYLNGSLHSSYPPNQLIINLTGLTANTNYSAELRAQPGDVVGPTDSFTTTASGPGLNIARGIFIDTASLDTSRPQPQAALNTLFQDTTTQTVTVSTNAQALTALNNSNPGDRIVYNGTAGRLTIGGTVNSGGGTRDNPVVVVAADGHRSKELRRNDLVIQEPCSGHIVFEGWIDDMQRQFDGAGKTSVPGIVVASSLVRRWNNNAIFCDSTPTSAGHFCGLFNCDIDFGIRNNTVPHSAWQTKETAASVNVNNLIPCVGNFIAYCRAVNFNDNGSEMSLLGAVNWDPVDDSILGGKRRFMRMMHSTIDGHNVGPGPEGEAIETKAHEWQVYGCYLTNSASQFMSRYSDWYTMSGCVHDMDGRVRTVRLHSDSASVRLNAFINGGAGMRCVEVSDEDIRGDAFGPPPAGNGRIAHNLQATTNCDVRDNIFHTENADDAFFQRHYGHLYTLQRSPEQNFLRNIYCNQTGIRPIEYRTVGNPPSYSTLAQWEAANPDGLAADQIWLPETGTMRYEQATDFTFDRGPSARPLPWVDHPDDPLKHLEGTPYELPTDVRSSDLFDSLIVSL